MDQVETLLVDQQNKLRTTVSENISFFDKKIKGQKNKFVDIKSEGEKSTTTLEFIWNKNMISELIKI